MSTWFHQWTGDFRDPDRHERDDTAGPVFSRLFVGMLRAAATIGLIIGALWTIAGLWHAYVALR